MFVLFSFRLFGILVAGIERRSNDNGHSMLCSVGHTGGLHIGSHVQNVRRRKVGDERPIDGVFVSGVRIRLVNFVNHNLNIE